MAVDLLEKLLRFDPGDRISVEEALEHEYVKAYHESEDEPVHKDSFDFAFEKTQDIHELKALIVEEVLSFQLI
jgi:mitogen-activated protein kinase 7